MAAMMVLVAAAAPIGGSTVWECAIFVAAATLAWNGVGAAIRTRSSLLRRVDNPLIYSRPVPSTPRVNHF